MEEIGILETERQLSEIAQRVQQTGESVTLLKDGQPVADVVPHQEPTVRPKLTKAQAIAELSRLRETLPKSSFEQIKADIAEGRR